jgi:hypothetical protein
LHGGRVTFGLDGEGRGIGCAVLAQWIVDGWIVDV